MDSRILSEIIARCLKKLALFILAPSFQGGIYEVLQFIEYDIFIMISKISGLKQLCRKNYNPAIKMNFEVVYM